MLSGLAKCHGCGNLMTVLDGDPERPPRYACSNAMGPDEEVCDTPEVETRRLDELVLDHLIADVLTDELLQEIIAHVRQDAARQALRQQHHLDSVHGEFERLNRERPKLAADVEQGETAYAKVADRLARLGDGWRSKQDEGRQADHALQGYRYVAGDEDRIASYARNPETYLRDMNSAPHQVPLGANCPGSSGVSQFGHRELPNAPAPGQPSRRQPQRDTAVDPRFRQRHQLPLGYQLDAGVGRFRLCPSLSIHVDVPQCNADGCAADSVLL